MHRDAIACAGSAIPLSAEIISAPAAQKDRRHSVRRQVEQRHRQAVASEAARRSPSLDVRGKQEFDGGDPSLRRSVEASRTGPR
jgi:hypothetical protein